MALLIFHPFSYAGSCWGGGFSRGWFRQSKSSPPNKIANLCPPPRRITNTIPASFAARVAGAKDYLAMVCRIWLAPRLARSGRQKEQSRPTPITAGGLSGKFMLW